MTKQQNVVALLLAEFDLAEGASLRKIYPENALNEFQVDRVLLAELMLPDGSHLRDHDSTVIFLNRQEQAGRSRSRASSAVVQPPQRAVAHSQKSPSQERAKAAEHYDGLATVLTARGMELGFALFQARLDAQTSTELARLYLSRGSFTDFFRTVLRSNLAHALGSPHEFGGMSFSGIGMTRKPNESNPFTALLWVAGQEHMVRTLQPVFLQALMGADGTIGGNDGFYSVITETEIDIAGPQLLELCELLLAALLGSAANLPTSLMSVFVEAAREFHDKSERSGPVESCEDSVRDVLVFFFEQYVVPALIEPSSHGLTAEPVGEKTAKTLVLASTVLSHVATGQAFDEDTEPLMAFSNECIKHTHQLLVEMMTQALRTGLANAPLNCSASTQSDSGAHDIARSVDLRRCDWAMNELAPSIIKDKAASSPTLAMTATRLYGAPTRRVHGFVTSYVCSVAGEEGTETDSIQVRQPQKWVEMTRDGSLQSITLIPPVAIEERQHCNDDSPDWSVWLRSQAGGISRIITGGSDIYAEENSDGLVVLSSDFTEPIGLRFVDPLVKRKFVSQVRVLAASVEDSGFDIGMQSAGAVNTGGRGMLTCLSCMSQRRDDSSARATFVRAVGVVVTAHTAVDNVKPLLERCVDLTFTNRDVDPLERLWDALQNMEFPAPPHDDEDWNAICHGALPLREPSKSPIGIDWGGEMVHVTSQELQPMGQVVNSSLSLLVRTFKEDVAILYDALISERRVIFFGRGVSAGTVTNLTLAAAASVAPARPTVLHQTYPYASLKDTSFTETDGFIAGVANPIFESHPTWWDVFADCDKGRIICSRLMTPAEHERILSAYSDLTGRLLLALHPPSHAESRIRRIFHAWTLDLVEATLDLEMAGDTDDAVLIGSPHASPSSADVSSQITCKRVATALSVCGWAGTHSMTMSVARRQKSMLTADGRAREIARIGIERLRRGVVCELGTEEALALLRNLRPLASTASGARYLLSLLPCSRGGLAPLASLLFHRGNGVRIAAATTLLAIESSTQRHLSAPQTLSGRAIARALDSFCASAFNRTLESSQSRLLRPVGEA